MFSIARLPQRAEIPIIARAFDIMHRLLDSFDMLQTSSRCNRHEIMTYVSESAASKM